MTTTVSEETFLELVQPLRRELIAHCYRMVGSVHDAEDLVQETYLRAWRGFHGFENRSSVRTWMHRIATNTCLTALENAARRPLPDDVLWSDAPADPESIALDRESVRLAFIAALQHLTGQQRAVLLLRDVLAWRAEEVADALDLSVGAVTSTLQRARAHLANLDPGQPPRLPDDDPRLAELLDEYVAAFEVYDVARIVALLTADATGDMPPYQDWYRGATDIGRLVSLRCPATGPGSMRLLRTSANGAPAVAVYLRERDGVHRAFQIQHLRVTADGVAAVTVWFDVGLFATFGLPAELPPRT